MAKRSGKSEEARVAAYAHVESYDVRSSMAFNIDLLGYLRDDIPDDAQVFEANSTLIIRGIFYSPKERVGEHVELTLYGERASRPPLCVKDIHARDKNHSPMYRTVRGKHIPVLNLPSGFTTIERRRSDRIWASWIFVEPRLVTDMLIVLATGRPTYLSLYEKKADRRRWVTDVTLQTSDPAAEE